MQAFGEATRAWFQASFEGATPVQEQGWAAIARREHALLLAPTGSGKTLAAFLWAIDRLTRLPEDAEPGVRVVYVSPLKALVYDVERNLRAPLRGIEVAARRLGLPLRMPRVAVRTGDTSQKERRDQAKHPAEILVTTPESLYLVLGAAQRETLRTVETVIVDEVHALAPTKRGAHLGLSLERLAQLTQGVDGDGPDPQRIGLSATARPVEEVARYLGGHRGVSIVDTARAPQLDLRIVVPVADMTRPELELPPEGEPPADESADAGAVDGAEYAAADGEVVIGDDGDGDDWAIPGGGSLLFTEDDLDVPASAQQKGLWPTIYPRLLELIRAHRTTIVFVNSRGLCERLTQHLNELADPTRDPEDDDAEHGEAAEVDGGERPPPLVRSHHGSLSHEERRVVEEQLKAGEIRAIVATSSLELGIDMGTVDLVVLVESPGSVASGLQRIGRAGHGVGQVSMGRLFPKHRGDLLETTVVAQRMTEGAIEALRVPDNPLDVLAQQVVAMCGLEPWPVDQVERVVRRAASFRELPKDAFIGVLDMLSGKYPSSSFADLRPRLVWDRERDVLTARRGARMLAATNGGTIPDRGSFGVYLGADGPRVGELDEEMVHETVSGATFVLGASTWRVEEITRDRVIVSPAPGEPGRLPFWRGEGPGRPIELGRALGAFTRELDRHTRSDPEAAQGWLREHYALDAFAAKNLVDFLADQREATGTVPTDQSIVLERFRDELGDWRVAILSPFGARVHAPWALAVEAHLSKQMGFEIQAMWSDDGIVLRFADADEPPTPDTFLPDPEEVEDLLVEQLADSALFASQFRENAGRALLLPRRRPGSRTPLWQQRLKASQLLAVAREFPSFPIVMETYRSVLKDVFDLPALVELLQAIRRKEVRFEDCETTTASPFARSLVFDYVAAYLYEGDSPLAERRAQALALDRNLLRELLGQEELRELLDGEVIDELEHELQHLDPDYRARHPDALHDLLRRVGDLDDAEVRARCAPPADQLPDGGAPGDGVVDDGEGSRADPGQVAVDDWLDALLGARRVVRTKIGGVMRWVAVEDVALYRDALGAVIPPGIPAAFLEPRERPVEELVQRYARTHGPFRLRDLAGRFGLPEDAVRAVLEALEQRDQMVQGDFRPDGTEPEWCDPEVLRRIKRRTLAKLRNEVAPVEKEALSRFLPAWHGLGEDRGGMARLEEALVQLEGIPLPWSELERTILPARVQGFEPRMLDELGAMGWLVWVGHDSLGARDGRVALYRRERVGLLFEPPEVPDDLDETASRLLAHLERRGACFFAELELAAKPAPREEVLPALWSLVWAGLVTNDTFQPLRTLSLHRGTTARARSTMPSRRSRGGDPRIAGGRWSLVRELLGETEPTERAHARAVTLLERHGLVAREVADVEALPGAFSAVYKVFRAMEEAGKVRRGYFVEGIGGAQFAYPGAVDRLRGLRQPAEDPQALVLAATDPANPYGWILPWPEANGDAASRGTPRRAAGATVVLVDGDLALYLEKGGKALLTFPAIADQERALLAARALRGVPAASRKGGRIELIDGEPARRSSLLPLLRQAAFATDHKGVVLAAR